jgi:hypothetical protein
MIRRLASWPTKVKDRHQVITPGYDADEETIAGYLNYADHVMNNDAGAVNNKTHHPVKKQFKKLDTREKIDNEVKKMFQANFKGPGSKTTSLLSNMLHHYISFGNPGVSKLEVMHRVREFLEKNRLKLTTEDIKRIAAEHNFYITTIQ